MKLVDAARLVMSSVGDEPVKQIDLVKKIQVLTGHPYESCRGNVFRNVNLVPMISEEYTKVKHNGFTCYVKKKSVYRQSFNKPDEYYEMLSHLNTSDKIFTLCGTDLNCMKALDKSKTITVDKSPLTKPDLMCDIFSITERGSFNLDFEGILTKGKVKSINKLLADKIVLTVRKSKKSSLISNINMSVTKEFEYKSRTFYMSIFLLEPKPTPYQYHCY